MRRDYLSTAHLSKPFLETFFSVFVLFLLFNWITFSHTCKLLIPIESSQHEEPRSVTGSTYCTKVNGKEDTTLCSHTATASPCRRSESCRHCHWCPRSDEADSLHKWWHMKVCNSLFCLCKWLRRQDFLLMSTFASLIKTPFRGKTNTSRKRGDTEDVLLKDGRPIFRLYFSVFWFSGNWKRFQRE